MDTSLLTPAEIKDFQKQIWQFYQKNARSNLPWRLPELGAGFDPYKILVSEVMLQQTQVNRVVVKYQSFLEKFSTVEELAAVSLADVLREWSGLGYNRRAKFLHEAAVMIVRDHGGSFPKEQADLIKLPGVGVNTAGAIIAYSYNSPVVFIETNIRTVYIHHFFANTDSVTDKEVLAYVAATLDAKKSREWYWALMDYGSYLKTIVQNPSRKSKHYARQSAFDGSVRQIRGQVIKALTNGHLELGVIRQQISDERLDQVLKQLTLEGFISLKNSTYHLGK